MYLIELIPLILLSPKTHFLINDQEKNLIDGKMLILLPLTLSRDIKEYLRFL